MTATELPPPSEDPSDWGSRGHVHSLVLMAVADWRLAVPTACWWIAYLSFLSWFVPRMRNRARRSAEGSSALIGRIVDSYANILTVKLFARTGSGTVIGGVIVAPHASELILPIAIAIEHRLTVDQVARAFAVYPSLSGSITDAARAMHIVA